MEAVSNEAGSRPIAVSSEMPFTPMDFIANINLSGSKTHSQVAKITTGPKRKGKRSCDACVMLVFQL